MNVCGWRPPNHRIFLGYCPKVLIVNRSQNAPGYEKHLYLEKDGKFRADLGNWEKDVLEIELQDEHGGGPGYGILIASLGLWRSLIVDAGSFKSMFPDMLIVRKDEQGFQFDILEPHDPKPQR